MSDTSERTIRFQKRCGRIAAACLVVAICAPLVVALGWMASGPTDVFQRHTGQVLRHIPSDAASLIGLALIILPALFISMSMLQARSCFLAFRQGGWFSEIPSISLTACGQWAFAAAICGFIVPILLGPVLTMGAPAGERILSISIGSGSVIGGLLGAILWSLGVVWARAHELSVENERFV